MFLSSLVKDLDNKGFIEDFLTKIKDLRTFNLLPSDFVIPNHLTILWETCWRKKYCRAGNNSL